MIAEVEWTSLTVASAFVLGAALATLATIRVVRAISNMFADLEDRRLRRRSPTSSSSTDDEHDADGPG